MPARGAGPARVPSACRALLVLAAASEFAAHARRSPRADEVLAAARRLRQHRPAVRQFDWRRLARR